MKCQVSSLILRERLERIYTLYHRRELVHPDPLQFLYDYGHPRDREVIGLVASCLAYGRVAQILKSVSSVLRRMQPSPSAFLMEADLKSLLSAFRDFRHRFTTGEHLARMLWAAKGLIEGYGSLQSCFTASLREDAETVLPALSAFAKGLNACPGGSGRFSLIPSPDRGSACKRLNLFLRWMVRQDEVDPGGWRQVPRSKLIIPLDVHMHRVCLLLQVTTRKQADLRTALDITGAFREIAPEDPTRYDFALTRLGIRKDAHLGAFTSPTLTLMKS